MKIKNLIYLLAFMSFISTSLCAAHSKRDELRFNLVLDRIIESMSVNEINNLADKLSRDLLTQRINHKLPEKIIEKYRQLFKVKKNILNTNILVNIANQLLTRNVENIPKKKTAEIIAEMEKYVPLQAEAELTLVNWLKKRNEEQVSQENAEINGIISNAFDQVQLLSPDEKPGLKRKSPDNDGPHAKKQKTSDENSDKENNTPPENTTQIEYKNAAEIKDFINHTKKDTSEEDINRIIKIINYASTNESDYAYEKLCKENLINFLINPSTYKNKNQQTKGEQFKADLFISSVNFPLKYILNIQEHDKEKSEKILKFALDYQPIFNHFLQENKPFILID